MSQSYYNTTRLEKADLKNAIIRAKKQEEAILLLFKNTDRSYSPSQVLALMNKAGKNWPLTSCRRALTNLCSFGDLVKTDEQVKGMYGMMEHKWAINRRKHPSNPITEQQKIF